ncbi:signal peptidase II [Rhizobium paknamense]|uniref:Lipoprotein signal peptidase n=1 Tax=Rhizobium paknamense TaxID=1206817 RepID=A0ABU0IDN0_9HYPH|nr:signal peptidase II [Rhizobium paknamense]MDQ0455319.1 signal peptidase II [Rhizobium paknamense]
MTTSPALFSRPVAAIAFILAALFLDQAVKYAVEVELPMHELVHVVPMLGLFRTHNLGVAFSMLSHLDAWAIVGMRLAIVAFVLWLWRNTSRDHRFAHLGYSLIIAGAFGNIIDRFVYGYVVDYILFYTDTWSFAVFNLADSYISIGAGLILLEELLLLRRNKS